MSDVIQMCYTDSHLKGVSPRATNTGDVSNHTNLKGDAMNNDNSETVLIPLTKGYIAFVDPIDSELAELKWTANVDSKNGVVYAHRGKPKSRSHIKLHRVIMARMLGRDLLSSERVDHWDGNGLNNHRANLRLATTAQNAANSRLPRTNTSGYKGVSWVKELNKWRAQISINSKRTHLGFYNNPQEAYAAYCDTALKVYGEFARLENTDNLPVPNRLIRKVTDVSEARYCAHCGKLLERKSSPSGKLEALRTLKARKFCNVECYAAHGRFQVTDRRTT